MAQNPFDLIDARLSNIENLLLDLKHHPKEVKPDTTSNLKFIPIQEIFNKKICSKPTFYAHLRKGLFTLYKFGNKSFVDEAEFKKAFHGVHLGDK